MNTKETRTSGITMRHSAGAAVGGNSGRLRLADLEDDPSPSVYVINNGTKIMGQPTHVIVPHKSSQSGEVDSFEIPMTFIPIDLSTYAPKEELLKSPALRSLLAKGILTLMRSEEAENILDTPRAVTELARLRALVMSRLRASSENTSKNDGDFQAMHPAQTNMPELSRGELSSDSIGVTPSVASVVTGEYNDDDRYVMILNLLDILTDNDRRYIRSHIRDARILEAIG